MISKPGIAVVLAALVTVSSLNAADVSTSRLPRGVTWKNADNVMGVAAPILRDDHFDQGVLFQLFTRNNPDEPELVDIYNFRKPNLNYFDASRPTKITVHGWQTDGVGVLGLRRAFLHSGDVNFILVNWTSIDTIFYPSARNHVPQIAQRVAWLLDFLRIVYGVPLSAVHLVGHSVGAHIAGQAGGMVQWGRLGRITGLDPAGPLFPDNPVKRLDSSNADFVDVIHTCGNFLGYSESIGHVDFFPNGGTCIQPGCTYGDLTHGTCSHNRAYDFMEESIYEPDSFKAYPCSGLHGQPDATDPLAFVLMGLAVPEGTRGTYCVKTRSEKPFAMRETEEGTPSTLLTAAKKRRSDIDNEELLAFMKRKWFRKVGVVGA